MGTGSLRGMIRDLRRAVLLRDAADLSDGQLLDWFITHGENAAFEALVRRHGPMVLGLCRRILAHSHDAEDAFQATFLVLMRKATSIAKREVLGAWLYGVAYRIAVRAKTSNARRRAKERQASDQLARKAAADDVWTDLEPILDEELHRLPSKYRVPLVLCELEGQSRRDAARQLRLPEGTLSSRLARGRDMLRRRLQSRGVVVSSAALAMALSLNGASASVPASLTTATLTAATVYGAGSVAAGVSAKAALMAEGALKSLLLSKLKIGLLLLVGAGLFCAGVGAGIHFSQRTSGPRGLTLAPDRGGEAIARLEDCSPELPLCAGPEEESDPFDETLAMAQEEGEPDIAPPPPELRCDPFYKKHLSARGLPILSSERVSDRALREAVYLVNAMLESRPDIRDAMIQSRVRFVVMHESEKTTDLPEQRDLKPKESWDRIRALGDRMNNCTEENLLQLPGDSYPGKNILIHAVAHCVHLKGLNRIDRDFDRKLRQTYRRALARGLWKDTRAASSPGEYWAEAVQSYFDSNNNPVPPSGASGCVNTREELKAYDPEIHRLIDEVFRGLSWRYHPPDQRR